MTPQKAREATRIAQERREAERAEQRPARVASWLKEMQSHVWTAVNIGSTWTSMPLWGEHDKKVIDEVVDKLRKAGILRRQR